MVRGFYVIFDLFSSYFFLLSCFLLLLFFFYFLCLCFSNIFFLLSCFLLFFFFLWSLHYWSFFESFHGETDTFCNWVKCDDFCLHIFSNLSIITDLLDHIMRDFGKMDESADSTREREEYSKLRYAHNRSLDDISNLVFFCENLPRIWLESFHGEADFVSVDTDNLDGYLVSNFGEFTRIVHMSPIDFRYMHETFESVECNEETIRKDTTDHSVDIVADFEFFECCSASFFESCFFGEDNLLAILIDIDNTNLERFPDETVEVLEDTFWIRSFHTRIVGWCELRNWDESLDPIEIDEETSLVCFIWYNGNNFFCVKIRMEFRDEFDLARFSERKNEESGISIITDDDRIDHVSSFDIGSIICRRMHMSSGNNPGKLPININKYHLLCRTDNCSCYDFTHHRCFDWC